MKFKNIQPVWNLVKENAFNAVQKYKNNVKNKPFYTNIFNTNEPIKNEVPNYKPSLSKRKDIKIDNNITRKNINNILKNAAKIPSSSEKNNIIKSNKSSRKSTNKNSMNDTILSNKNKNNNEYNKLTSKQKRFFNNFIMSKHNEKQNEAKEYFLNKYINLLSEGKTEAEIENIFHSLYPEFVIWSLTIEPSVKIDNSSKETDPIIERYSSTHSHYINKQYQIYKENGFNLTICDAVYLYQYIFDGYTNGILRKDPMFMGIKNKNLLDFFNKIIQTLDDYFINHAPRVTKEMVKTGKNVIYRGEKKLCDNDTCRVGVMPSFTSSTTKKDIAQNFSGSNCCLYKYVLPEGTPYIDVNRIMEDTYKNCGKKLNNKFEGEHEYILPRGIILSDNTECYYDDYKKAFEKHIIYDPDYIKNNPIL